MTTVFTVSWLSSMPIADPRQIPAAGWRCGAGAKRGLLSVFLTPPHQLDMLVIEEALQVYLMTTTLVAICIRCSSAELNGVFLGL